MAPTPVQNTPRLVYHYTTGRKSHSTLFRFATGITVDVARDVATDFFEALGPALVGTWSTQRADWYPDETVNSIPVAGLTIVTGGVGNVLLENLEPRFISWGGRGPANDKTRYTVFGALFGVPDDYRIELGAFSEFDAARDVLTTANDGGRLVTIKGNSMVAVYPYYNVGYNSYHERQARR